MSTIDMPLDTLETLHLTPADFAACKLQLLAVEQGRYGAATTYPPDVLRDGRRPLLEFPLDTLEATMADPRAIAIALRDRVSARIVGYVLAGALENHNEEGVMSDPHFGDYNTCFIQALATLPLVQNAAALENLLLEALRRQAIADGFEFLSTLIESRVVETGPPWLTGATVLKRVENYLRSGIAFVYVQIPLPTFVT